MGLNFLLNEPYYSGSGSVVAGGDLAGYHVAIGGHKYLIDRESNLFKHETLPMLKPSEDTGLEQTEASLNPEGLWRRSQISWHRGAGQLYRDKEDSDKYRFRHSKGIDVWTKYQISLLPESRQVSPSATTTPSVAIAGAYLYYCDGLTIKRTTDLSTFTPVQLLNPGLAITSMVSSGGMIYYNPVNHGIHQIVRASSTDTHYSDLNAGVLGYVKGRLMASGVGADQHKIYNVTASGAAPAALFTHDNTDFSWVGFAAAKQAILAAGYSGDKSLVYRIPVKEDGTGLDVPIIAGELPDGEVVYSIYGYLGQFILIGTDKGVRFALADDNGNLTIGGFISTPHPVRCFDGQEKYVWFGWTNMDNTNTGLGRLDLQEITDRGAPAYATDLFAGNMSGTNVQGDVMCVASFIGRRVFGIRNVGLYAQMGTGRKVDLGYIESGWITFGIPESKVALLLDHRYLELFGEHESYVRALGGTYQPAGSHSPTSTQNQSPVPQIRSELFEIKEELKVDQVTNLIGDKGPIITRWTLKAQPVYHPGTIIFCPVILAEWDNVDGSDKARDIETEISYLEGLRSYGGLVTYQEGKRSFQVTVTDVRFIPLKFTPQNIFDGTCLVEMKVAADDQD